MIKKLLVLNGTESHNFEVGQQYNYFGIIGIVKKIESNISGSFTVYFDDHDSLDVVTKNVMVYWSH